MALMQTDICMRAICYSGSSSGLRQPYVTSHARNS